jgi:hypothetical protein
MARVGRNRGSGRGDRRVEGGFGGCRWIVVEGQFVFG